MARRNGPRRTDATIAIKGLDEFRRELRHIEREGGPDGLALLKDANERVAQHIVNRAQSRAAGLGPLWVRAAGSLRAARQQARAVVRGGGARFPFFHGAEFGSYQGLFRQRSGWSGRGWNQFRPWKRPGSGNTGYFLYPTMRDEVPNVLDMYADELDRVAAAAFPD